MRVGRFLFRASLLVIAGGVAAAVWFTPYDPPAWTRGEVTHLVDVINEASSVIVPHKTLGKKIRFEHQCLFEKVEKGTELSEAETAEYRKLYQQIIFNNQFFFSSYDHQVTILQDVGPDADNNIGGKGIAGSHDHHDASAHANLDLLKSNLARIDAASGSFAPLQRIFAAAKANKNLTDIMLHLGTAPQTVSVSYMPGNPQPGDALGQDYETVLREFKTAQFAPMNSPAYVNALHAALNAYDRMVLNVQDHVRTKLSPWERTLAGRWLSWQSLTPPLGSYKAYRFPRRSG
jgi:hypothetical protein